MSTSNKPILFFQNFLEKNHFNNLVKNFYTDYDNPTFYANLEGGYVEYIDRVYLEGEDSSKPRKIYFKDYLLNILDSQKIISIRLIQDKIEDIENFGNSPAFYISKTKVNLTKLKTSIIISRYENKDLILSILDEIEGVLKNQKSQPSLLDKQPPKIKPYFRPYINKAKLIKIYIIARTLDILDIETTTENDFTSVFLDPNPAITQNKITFKTNNRRGLFFIICMFKYFENLKPSTMDHSQSFFSRATKNKESNLLKHGSIYNVINYMKYNSKNNFSDIEEAFKTLDKVKH